MKELTSFLGFGRWAEPVLVVGTHSLTVLEVATKAEMPEYFSDSVHIYTYFSDSVNCICQILLTVFLRFLVVGAHSLTVLEVAPKGRNKRSVAMLGN